MKRFFTFILCTISIICLGQSNCTSDSTYSNISYNILRPLDKTQIPTGILIDYVFPMATLENYDGSANTDISDISHFEEAYAEMYQSMLNNYGKIHPEELYRKAQSISTDKKFRHAIGLIDYNYNVIDTNAVTNNQFNVINGQLHDVVGRTSSPYLLKTARLASVLSNSEYPCLYPGLHYFKFSSNFVLSNTTFALNLVTNLKAYKDGVLLLNTPVSGLEDYEIPISIPNVATETSLTLVLTVSGVDYTYNILSCQVAHEPITSCRGTDQIEVTGFTFDGGYGEGQYSERGIATIYWADNNCSTKALKKAIILVDGFDPFNSQHHEGLWADYLNLQFTENLSFNKLGNELLANGYDVIILDQLADTTRNFNRGGAGLVENNGLVLAKLLDTLYQIYQPSLTDEFVVVGASMGGLVARYGLSWMEQNNIPHHTRLFISFDSPQNGAQINLGLQRTLDNFTQQGLLSNKNELRFALHQSNAARQMLLHHSGANSEAVAAHPFRNIMLANFNAVGNYPSQCRNISIINGNRDGVLKPVILSPNTYGAEPVSQQDKIIGVGLARKFFGINCNLPRCRIFEINIFAHTSSSRFKTNEMLIMKTALTRLVNFVDIPFRTIIQFAVAENGSSYDIAPGSRFGNNPLEKIRDAYNNNVYPFASTFLNLRLIYSKNIIKDNNFIPTVSSAAYIPQNQEPYSINQTLTGVNLSRCAGTTPFDTVYTPAADMPHVKIDAFIAQAFRGEVYQAKPKSICTFDCPETIVSSATIENGERVSLKAQKSISLIPQPPFEAKNGSYFLAQIGCSNAISFKKNTLTQNNPPINCSLELDFQKTEVICGSGANQFNVFAKNVPQHDYIEVMTHSTPWFRANFGDSGSNWLLLANPGQPQVFNVRLHNNPSQTFSVQLNHCPI